MEGKRTIRLDDAGPAVPHAAVSAAPVARIMALGGDLAPPKRMDNGWAQFDGRLTRTGVFVYQYRNADGSLRTIRELRHPADVWDPASVRSFDLVPVTIDHPPVFLDATNTKAYAVGAVGIAEQDGDFMRAPLMVTDAQALEAIGQGAQELSCGYTCILVDEVGEYNGEKYDVRQTQIRGNHVALVTMGRAGRDARLRSDAELLEKLPTLAICAAPAATPTNRSDSMKFKVRIDGVDYEVESESLKQAFDKATAMHEQTAKALKTATDAEATARARADAAEAELAKVKAALAAATDPQRVDSAVAERAELVATATAVMGKEWKPTKTVKVDGKDAVVHLSAIEIKRDVAAKLGSPIPAGETDAYVSGMFAALVKGITASIAANRDAVSAVTSRANPARRAQPINHEDAQAAYARKMANAWRTDTDDDDDNQDQE